MEYDPLLLRNQLCFPLYAAAREVVGRYTPLLSPLGLTYTQYIAMMALWEHRRLNVKALGALLRLDSGTLTPLLKKLEQRGYIRRERSREDERSVDISLTPAGEALRQQAAAIPAQLRRCIPLSDAEMVTLYQLLYQVLEAQPAPGGVEIK